MRTGGLVCGTYAVSQWHARFARLHGASPHRLLSPPTLAALLLNLCPARAQGLVVARPTLSIPVEVTAEGRNEPPDIVLQHGAGNWLWDLLMNRRGTRLAGLPRLWSCRRIGLGDREDRPRFRGRACCVAASVSGLRRARRRNYCCFTDQAARQSAAGSRWATLPCNYRPT